VGAKLKAWYFRWFPATAAEWADDLATMFLIIMAILFFGGAAMKLILGL